MTPTAERARDLLTALEALVRQRTAVPDVYRAVHVAAAAAIGELHADLLDPRGGDFDAGVAEHAELARRLRELPRPMSGQTGPGQAGPGQAGPGGLGLDPFAALLGRARRSGTTLDSLLGDLASGVAPQVERAVREGLRDLVGRLGRADAPGDEAGGAAGGAVPDTGPDAASDAVWDEPVEDAGEEPGPA
jgi:hypothetical protein